jgi:hypothetical protein
VADPVRGDPVLPFADRPPLLHLGQFQDGAIGMGITVKSGQTALLNRCFRIVVATDGMLQTLTRRLFQAMTMLSARNGIPRMCGVPAPCRRPRTLRLPVIGFRRFGQSHLFQQGGALLAQIRILR